MYRAQIGRTPPHTKPLRGFAENVMEIAVEHHRGAFRAVYVATIGDRIFVLHAFQKKSHKGISTAHRDVALIRERLKQAIQLRLKR